MPKKIEKFGDYRDDLCLGLWNHENKDFTIIADGKEFKAHKNVLAVRSPVFARMFQSDLKEAQENKVEIKDFSLDVVEAAIKLCYHQSLVSYATLEDKIKLLQFFDKYDIAPLKDDLENNLISEIDETTVCQLANCSLLSNASNLKEKCAEFIQKCVDEKTPVSDFSLLDKDFALKLFQKMYKYPFAVKWLIEENRLKELKDNPGSFLESDLFSTSKIPGLRYYLSFYPNGDLEERLGQTWIFLQLEFSGKIKIESEVSVLIESANFCFTENYVYEKTAGWGDMICTTDELFDPENEYITDGKMIIKVEGILM
uniref:BTB domain-containing protein n=1 Tax=Panagrolaimus sp. ES5 TaxID=591445 RepID=A0AC34FNM1_9BILA